MAKCRDCAQAELHHGRTCPRPSKGRTHRARRKTTGNRSASSCPRASFRRTPQRQADRFPVGRLLAEKQAFVIH